MSNEMTYQTAPHFPQPFQREQNKNINAGAVSIESERAIADAQGALIIAKRFPRNINAALEQFLVSCSNPSFASSAFYSMPRGSQTISGPSIRFAEEAARCMTNIEFGIRELSREEGRSEVEAFCWDKETNTKSVHQFSVRHVIDLSGGKSKDAKSERDIDDLVSNKGGRRLRARILAIIPKWFQDEGIEACRKTLAGQSTEPLPVRIRKMMKAFANFGVTEKMLTSYMEKPLDQVTLDELIDLTGVYNALRDGAKPSEYFGAAPAAELLPPPAEPTPTPQAQTDGAPAAAQPEKRSTRKKQQPATTEPEPEPQQQQQPVVQEPQAVTDTEPQADPEREQATDYQAEPESNAEQTTEPSLPSGDDQSLDSIF